MGFSISDGLPHAELIARYGATPVRGFGTAHTLAEVAALSPREFLARAFALSDSVFTAEDSQRRPQLTRTIVGDVVERDSSAHVLYRTTGPTVHSTDSLAVDVLRLRRRGSGWLVDLPMMEHDFLGGVIISQMDDRNVR